MKKESFKILKVLIPSLFIFTTASFAQDSKDTKALTSCICEADPGLKDKQLSQKSLVCFEELKNSYLKENKFSEFVDFLKSEPCPGNKAVAALAGYSIASTRYSQLKYLEDSKNWDEYFAKGNDYRDDIINGAVKAIGATKVEDPLNIRARLLLFQFHKDLQDNFAEASLADLTNSVQEYARSGSDIEVIKEVADKLLASDEKGKSRELYKIYAKKLASSDIDSEALKGIAVDFYNQGNIELSENVYNTYIDKVSSGLSKEELLKELGGIGIIFAYQDNNANDMFYAEEIFKKMDLLGGQDAFDEELIYLRGFNLEKSKLFTQAKDVYVDLIKRFPKSKHADEVIYKTGIIYVYILRDLKTGRTYFEQLAQIEPLSPQRASSLYQLGLLKQWEGESLAARKYYNKLLEKLKDSDADRLAALKERLKEIDEKKSLDYNLKVAIDTALKDEYANLDMGKLDLKATSYRPKRGKELGIGSSAYIGATGCLQIELQYLWSGDLGGLKPASNASEFKTTYKSSGTQVINAVMFSPTGIASRNIDFVDVD
ncbi:MAG: hypothetical protein NTZ63_06380 [Candidatus Omnitrophica bacterium]|nr:hypothetical protein [Candidatus Omnitrophota bacterium]